MNELTTIQNPPHTTEEFLKGLWKENPVFVAVLGMCPVLAVTNTAINSLAMGLATRLLNKLCQAKKSEKVLSLS